MQITRTSILTGITRTLDIPVTPLELACYSAGALVQDAFPSLSPDEREFIKTGITSEEWDSLQTENNL
jgi:hypothetical protein